MPTGSAENRSGWRTNRLIGGGPKPTMGYAIRNSRSCSQPRSSQCSRCLNQRTSLRTTSSTDSAPAAWASAALSSPFWPPPTTSTRWPAKRPNSWCSIASDTWPDASSSASCGRRRGNGVTPTADTTCLASISSPASVCRRKVPLDARSTSVTFDSSTSGTNCSRNQSEYRRKVCNGTGSMRSPPTASAQHWSVPRSPGVERRVSVQWERRSIPGGIMVLHVRIGAPKTRTARMRAARCAATDSP